MRRAIVCLAMIAATATAHAGGTSLDGRDEDHDHGPSIVGWVRNIAGIAPIENARVTADSKLASTSLVTRTDPDGAFRFSGLGEDFPLDQIEVSCTQDNFKMIDVLTRRLSKDPAVPIEIVCIMERK